MKKILVYLIALILLTGCSQGEKAANSNGKSGGSGGGSVSVEVKKDNNVNEDSKKEKPSFNKDEVLDKLVTTSYTWNTEYDNCLALVIKNTSSLDCELNVDVSFKDADGNLLGVKEDSVDAFGVGGEICLVFDNEEAFASYEYEYSVEEIEYYEAVNADLTCEATPAKNKVIVSVTNNGDKIAKYVTASVLFMKGDKVVGWSYTFVGDNDGEIKSGSKETDEVHFYDEFDSAKVYLSGCASK